MIGVDVKFVVLLGSYTSLHSSLRLLLQADKFFNTIADIILDQVGLGWWEERCHIVSERSEGEREGGCGGGGEEEGNQGGWWFVIGGFLLTQFLVGAGPGAYICGGRDHCVGFIVGRHYVLQGVSEFRVSRGHRTL